MISTLQYLNVTRPDITYVVNKLCQYMHNLFEHHFQLLKCLMQYLKGTILHSLCIRPGPLTLTAYSNADWAGDADDIRYTSGFSIFSVTPFFCGKFESKRSSLAPPPKPNIILLPPVLLNSFGFVALPKNFIFLSHNLLIFIVIMF